MPFTINKPSPSGNWPKADHVGHLHMFVNGTDFTGETKQGQKPGETYLAVSVDHVVCVDCVAVWNDQLISGAALAPRIADSPAGVVVGQFEQGDAKPGRSPAWLLYDPSDSDVSRAEQFLEKYATTLPSGAIALDVRAIRDESSEPF